MLNTSKTNRERYERLAAEFNAETDMMAPGKDDPTGHHSYDERWEAWHRWLRIRNAPATSKMPETQQIVDSRPPRALPAVHATIGKG